MPTSPSTLLALSRLSGAKTKADPTAQVNKFVNNGIVGSALNRTTFSSAALANNAASDLATTDSYDARQAAITSRMASRNKWSEQITDYMKTAKQNASKSQIKSQIPSTTSNGVATSNQSNSYGSGYTNDRAATSSGYAGAQQLATQAGGVRGQIISAAADMLGTPYAWGGGGIGVRSSYGIGKGTQNTYGVDCSGLTSYVYSLFGVNLPRKSDTQYTAGIRTNINNAQPGDLVGWSRGGHVAIYAGNGYIIESPNVGKTVRLRPIGSNESVFAIHLTLPGE